MIRLNLSSPIGEVSRIGKTVAVQLRHLGVLTLQDLLFYFPARYDDLSKITPIGHVQIGARVVVKGRLELIEASRSRFRRKLLTHAIVSDGSGSIRVVWYNQPWIAKMFKPGDELYLVGEVKDEKGSAYLSSPVYEKVARAHAATHVARIVPVYPSTEKLSQKQIRYLMQHALPLAKEVPDPLPDDMRRARSLIPLSQALTSIHFPQNDLLLERARRRLKFDELLRLQIFAASLKHELKKIPAPRVAFQDEDTKKFVESLPFKLTDGQRKAAWEIIGDLSGRDRELGIMNNELGVVHPMNRLLEGDVGSGKTVVVAIAAFNAVLGNNVAGYRGQVAIMAPTGILARQHFATFTKLLTPHGISVELRTGDEKKKKIMIEADVVVGTHALIQEAVQFRNLVLAVVDEQHRFGVSQRAALKEKRSDGAMPHLLTLTATPIPRSLALIFYGDLDISILKEMPKGRQRIATKLVISTERSEGEISTATDMKVKRSLAGARDDELNIWNRKQAYNFVRNEIQAGRQVFWTCPIIDPSDTLGVKAATEAFEDLKMTIFKDLKIGLLHGRMKTKEREAVMEEFSSRAIDILVATPVIEVGIDIPNASVMVIEGSERFGLAQLHQFRGRVGRGEAKSYCLLMVDEGEMRARIQAFLECDSGFELAERDLALRGPGEVYGMAQSGFPEFKIASFADVDIAKEAKEAAQELLAHDPELTHYPELKRAIAQREGKAHLE